MTYPRDRLKEKMEKNSGRVRCVITAGCQQGSSEYQAWSYSDMGYAKCKNTATKIAITKI